MVKRSRSIMDCFPRPDYRNDEVTLFARSFCKEKYYTNYCHPLWTLSRRRLFGQNLAVWCGTHPCQRNFSVSFMCPLVGCCCFYQEMLGLPGKNAIKCFPKKRSVRTFSVLLHEYCHKKQETLKSYWTWRGNSSIKVLILAYLLFTSVRLIWVTLLTWLKYVSQRFIIITAF